MSCHYPSCMMGGGSCPYKRKCDEEDAERWRIQEEKRLLDLEEQKARIEWLKSEIKKNEKDGE